MGKNKHAAFWNSFGEPHRVSGGGINKAKAEAILRLLDNGDAPSQAELNRLAAQFRLATPQDDAAAVNARMRKVAEGVLQQYAAGRFVDDDGPSRPAKGRSTGPSM